MNYLKAISLKNCHLKKKWGRGAASEYNPNSSLNIQNTK